MGDMDTFPYSKGPPSDDLCHLREEILEISREWPARRRRVVGALLEGCQLGEVAERVGVARRTVYRTLEALRDELSE